MINSIKSGFVIGLLTIGLVACTTTKPTVDHSNLQTQQKLTLPNTEVTGKPELSFENKKELLAEKIRLADFSIRAINDPNFVNSLLSDDINSKEDKQCVFSNIDREAFDELSNHSIKYFIANHSENTDLYLVRLDLLISIVDIFYNHSGPVDFDNEDLSASPALKLLPEKDALIFQEMIKDEDYKDLLIVVGQPAEVNGSIFDFSTMKFLILTNFVRKSEQQCNLDSKPIRYEILSQEPKSV